jgi:cytochrome c biogenesis factor
MEDLINSPYFEKIVLTILAIVLKLVIDAITKEEKDLKTLYKLLLICSTYILPIITIVWLNLDEKIVHSKLNTTLICLNFAIIVFNNLQSKINKNYKMIGNLAKTEFDKVKKVKQINEVQVEKIKAINENQKYILNELSKINDRILGHFKDKLE